jgi:hypothetical protein
MTYENQILDALLFLDWDLPDEDLADAVMDQARLMAGVCPDELGETLLN